MLYLYWRHHASSIIQIIRVIQNFLRKLFCTKIHEISGWLGPLSVTKIFNVEFSFLEECDFMTWLTAMVDPGFHREWGAKSKCGLLYWPNFPKTTQR